MALAEQLDANPQSSHTAPGGAGPGWTIAIAMAALAAYSLAVAKMVSARITKPVRMLAQMARQMERGDYHAFRHTPRHWPPELGQLPQRFREMAEGLEAAQAATENTMAELRRTKAFLDSIIDNLPDMVFVKDAAMLRFALMNRAGEKLIGIPREQFIGKTDYDFFPRDMADFFTRRDREVLASGKLLDIPEEPIDTCAQGVRYLHTKKIPIPDAQGQPQYLLGISEDITELKQAQEERFHFFNHAPGLLCITDHDGRILQASPAFENALGYPRGELQAQSLADLAHPDDAESMRALFTALRAQAQPSVVDTRMRQRDGTTRWVRWHATVDNAARKVFAIGRDMTELYAAEQEAVEAAVREQQRIARDLHDGVGQLLTALVCKATVFEQMVAASEVPTPVQAREVVWLAHSASEQIRIIARSLDPVILKQGLQPALQDLAHATTEVFGVPCQFHADGHVDVSSNFVAVHLYRIAQEAVNNAVRHGQPRSISLSLKWTNGRVQMVVADDGRGLPEDAADHNGQGIRNMTYRAMLIRSEFCITRNPGGGTMVSCTLRRTEQRNHGDAAPGPAPKAPRHDEALT